MRFYFATIGMVVSLVAMADAVGSSAEPAEPLDMVIRLVEQVDAPAKEMGALGVLNVSEGQLVTVGTLLAQVEDNEASLAVERAKLELEVARRNAENDVSVRFAKKSLEVAKAEMQRSIDSLHRAPKSVSDSEMDRLRLLVEKGTLEIEQAQREFATAASTQRIKENDYKVALEKLDRHRICAPIAGIVVRIYHSHGEWVKPGDSVVRILRLDRLRAEGFVKSRDLTADLKGRAVKLLVDFPNDAAHEFEGKISFVDPEVDPVNAQIRVWVEVQNPDLRLRPGMQAKVSLSQPGK